MADEPTNARRAKMILLVVVLLCVGISTSLIIAVIEGPRRGGRSRSSNPATNNQDSRLEGAALLASYGKSATCQSCHPIEFQQWASSHHALTERPISGDLDRSAFDPPRRIVEPARTSEVRVAEGKFEIVTTGLGSSNEVFVPGRVIGIAPLRQFLIAAPGGRFQSTELAFDPHAGDWFDVYGKENRQPGEWGHWTGRGMTWNSMCAACHNTRLRKNYHSATDSYTTAMAEMGVGCEACHGPLAAHNAWQQQHPKQNGDPTIKPLSRDQMFDVCGSCHARRAELTGDFKPGDRFFDHYIVSVPDETETFYPDGQIHEEDYEFSSFLGSEMHDAGVRCINCHNPHSGKTVAESNALCLTCHGAPVLPAPKIDPIAHSHHRQRGSDCVDCHMPQTTYMQRHHRHDHGFTIPDPLLTKQFGVPNACARCHQDRSTDWLSERVDQWYGKKMERPSRARARVIARARKDESGTDLEIVAALKTETNALWRAALVSLLKNAVTNDATLAALKSAAEDRSALVRGYGLRALEPLAQTDAAVTALVSRHLDDAARYPRNEAAWALRRAINTNSPAGRDLMQQLAQNSDQPAGALQMGVFHMDRGDLESCLAWMARAVAWDPNSAPLHHEYAIALSRAGKAEDAVRELQAACRLAPREAEYRFKLGLAYNEIGDVPAAKAALAEAVKLDPRFARAWYNLGLAQNAAGETDAAIEALLQAESLDPGSPLPPYARATVLARIGRTAEARAALRRALELQPNFSEAKDLLQSLQQ
jgi:Flp pilus assembly protein TadD